MFDFRLFFPFSHPCNDSWEQHNSHIWFVRIGHSEHLWRFYFSGSGPAVHSFFLFSREIQVFFSLSPQTTDEIIELSLTVKKLDAFKLSELETRHGA